MQQDYYGAPSNSDVKMIRERLRDLYDPEDFVTVINIDTKPVKYQFMAPQDIETLQSSPTDKNTVMRRPPQVVTLQPGDTKLCPAYEADMMIEATIKQIAMSKLNARVENEELSDRVATTDWTDPFFQTSTIKQIFVGKKDILNMYNQAQNESTSVEKDLELDKPKIGRPRKEV